MLYRKAEKKINGTPSKKTESKKSRPGSLKAINEAIKEAQKNNLDLTYLK